MRNSRVILAVLLILLVVPLAAYGYAGTYSRYMADDYCTAGSLVRNGFLGSQAYWFNHWSGRYSFTLAVSLIELIGSWVTRILPLLAIFAWILSLFFISQEIRAAIGFLEARINSIVLGCFVVLATLLGAPNIYQSLYWQTGMVTYGLPLVLMTAYFAWMIRVTGERAQRWPVPALAIASALVAFLIGGFSETYVSLQTAALGCFLILGWLLLEGSKRRTSVAVLAGGLLGSIASMGVIAAAPGTSVRQGVFAQSFSVTSLLGDSLYDWYLFTARTAKSLPLVLFVAVLLPAMLVLISNREPVDRFKLTRMRSFLFLLTIPLLTLLLMLATIVPYEFALSSYPDGRVLITTQYVLISGMTAWGIILGVLVLRFIEQQRAVGRLISTILPLLTLLGLAHIAFFSIRQTLTPIDDYRAFAASWDARHSYLRSIPAGSEGVIRAASLTHMGGLSEIGYDEDEWINRCVAWMYGLDGVAAK